MKDPQKNNRKPIQELRKHSVSQKTKSDYSNPFNPKEDNFSPFAAKVMKNSMGRKYAQEHLFKQKEKQHHEIVISDEVVKNSKLFRMLKEKIETNDAVFVKEMNELNQIKSNLKQQIATTKSNTYNHKLSLWELKNQILELRGILNDEEDESRRLEAEMNNPQGQYYPEQQDEREMDEIQNNGQQQNDELQQERLKSELQCKQESVYDEKDQGDERNQGDEQAELKTSFGLLQIKDYTNPENKSEVVYQKGFNE